MNNFIVLIILYFSSVTSNCFFSPNLVINIEIGGSSIVFVVGRPTPRTPFWLKAIFHCSRFARAGGANITQLSL
jgi:hypothetical protein